MSSEQTIVAERAEEVALRASVDALLAVDPATLDDAELHRLVVAMQAARSRLAVANAALLASWDARRSWEADGSRSAAHRLARETRASLSSARAELRRARRLEHVPATHAAAARGELTVDHLDLLAHVNTPPRRELFARDEALLVRECSRLSFADGARIVQYWAARADDELDNPAPSGQQEPDRANDEAEDPPKDAGADDPSSTSEPTDPQPGREQTDSKAQSRLYASRTLDGTLAIDGTFDAIDGTILERELHRLTEQIRLADLAAGIDRTPAQRRAAALVEMARRSATAPADGRPPRPLFTVLLGDRSFERLCELSNGTVTTPSALLPYLDQAVVESVLFDGATTVVSVSQRRTFVGAVRRAVQVRDRRCQHPSGCDVPADQCDVDHIVPHHQNGPTSQFNGRLQCPAHNRLHHLHDHDACPAPERSMTRRDELRTRLHWLHQRPPPRPSGGFPAGWRILRWPASRL